VFGAGFALGAIRILWIVPRLGSHARKLSDDLPGGTIQIRYNPADPNVSYLVDCNDSRFEGLAATQNPEWLGQSPEFDLQDAAR
jgi:hypothetical protein